MLLYAKKWGSFKNGVLFKKLKVTLL